ncbi:ATP-binding protein [Yinghuangia seranimata]|uniref:ATP-binding protein n=1 Tax=Yinghuangia seranimata TaxID=408067 RepID=UPI00248B4443|nr:ATP-binding protein [Yinghuangia seranimata]MDI2125391.1 ATP-binding protein [Yinghuangia seranimata]
MTPRDAFDPVVRTMVDDARKLVVDLDGSAGSVRAARQVAEDFLADLPKGPPVAPDGAAAGFVSGTTGSARNDALLVVAELVSNACRHAPGPCRLTVECSADEVEVAVRDDGPDWLRLGATELHTGYGLLIVTRLTGGIHVLPSGPGKVVFAAVPLRGAGPGLGDGPSLG